MDIRREDRIYELQQALADLDPARWPSFLETACSDDTSLRDEVLRRQRELTRDRNAYASSVAIKIPGEQNVLGTMLASGTRLGPYVIAELRGRGGMGEVYRARDMRLERDVAIKVLTSGPVAADGATQRTLTEARIIARLSHPYICALYDVGDVDDVHFLVMEFLEGETLARRITRDPLTQRDSLKLGLQLSTALDVAHSAGIIHGDVKPANVMLVKGDVKLMDFGIATEATSLRDTANATVVGRAGTLLYTSPEYLEFGRSDTRCDIFSLGVVLYEAAAGVHPFSGATPAAVVSAIVKSARRPLADHRPDLSRDFLGIVEKCLEARPEERWQHANEVLVALEAISNVGVPQTRRSKARQPSSRSVVSLRRIAVLPFENCSSAEDQYLADGFTQLLSFAIERIPELRVTALSSSRRYGPNPVDVKAIADELRVGGLVLGAVRRDNQRLRVVARLKRAVDGEELWSGTFERSIGDLSIVQNATADAIAAEVGIRLVQPNTKAAAMLPPPAQEAYLQGLFYLNDRSPDALRRALEFLKQSVQLAPEHPLPHSALAECYVGMVVGRQLPGAEALSQAARSAHHALRLDPRLARAHAALGAIAFLEWDPRRAIRECEIAIRLEPSLSVAYGTLGRAAMVLERHDLAATSLKTAQQLDPMSLRIRLLSLPACVVRRDFAECIQQCQSAERVWPGEPRIAYWSGVAHFLEGRYILALDDLRRATTGNEHPASKVALAIALAAVRRDAEEADRVKSELVNSATFWETTPYDFAELYAGLGMPDLALRYLRRALELRQPELIGVRVEPFFAALRSRPEFNEILRAAGVSDD
jgi:serine/threonine protein kinase/tetratricopeptide (TPR) repeat protein